MKMENINQSERALPVGTVLNGKYSIGAVIGEGGFGITYAAWDMLIETRIAIKEYFPSELVTRNTTLQEENAAKNLTLIQEKTGENRYREGLGRFVKEAENLAKFQKQPGIVSVKDFFYENNTAYMVMEYIDGVTLNSYLENHNGKLGKEETFRMMEPVMKTLEAMHKEGVIHRDISPDNIMVTADGQMKLIDFGAARFVGADDEKSLTVILKHGYAPEEQYRSNGEQSSWTDVYALSAVIYRMLTGKVPEETLKRMTEKQDSVHTELGKVPELSAAERKSLEKGLAVKAEKRFRTIEGLHERIYSNDEHRRNLWKLTAGSGLAAVVLGMIAVGMVRVKNKSAEEFSSMEKQDETDIEASGEETTKIEEEEEPENIRALREYYNDYCLGKNGKVYFVDLTGDDEAEMIDLEIENNMTDGISLWGTQTQSLTVYQYVDGTVKEIYHVEVNKEMSGEVMTATEINYYLSVEDGRGVILAEHCADSEEQVYKEQASFEAAGDGSVELTAMPEDEFREKRRHSILLLDSFTTMTPAWRAKEMLTDYQDVLDFMEETADVIEIAEASKETVLDYSVIYNDDAPCIFAVTGEIQSNQANTGYDFMAYYESGISVWTSYDGQVKKIEDSSSYEGYWMGSDIYQFGKSQHYFLLTGLGGAHYIAYTQHKFCFENNDAYKINNYGDFTRDENGKVQREWFHKVKELNGSYLRGDFGGGTGNGDEIYVQDSIDIFFYNQQYVEYGTEKVENAELEGYENYNEILQVIEEEFKDREGANIGAAPAYLYGMMSYYVQEIELDHVRKAVNNVYYLNYKVYGRRYGWDSLDFFDQYSKECDVWAYAVVEAVGSRLEYRRIVYGKREEFANVGMPVYYGPDKELVNVVYAPMESGIDFQTENQTGQWLLESESYYSSDGSVTSRREYEYEYSGTGYIQRADYGNGLYYESEFDEYGNEISSKGYDSNGIFQWWDYEYDVNGNQIKAELRWGSSEGGPAMVECEYSGNLLTKKTSYDSTEASTPWFWSEYEYDVEGNMIQERNFYFDEFEGEWKEWGHKYRYEYEGDTVITYTGDNLTSKIKYEYDDTGNMTKEIRYDIKGEREPSWTEYTYVYLEPQKGE